MEFLFPNLKDAAQKIMQNGATGHDWDHVLRVWKLARHIGMQEQANMRVLEAACLLHDIGRDAQDQSKWALCHAQIGSQMAVSMLENTPLEPSEKDNVIHCIATHRSKEGQTLKHDQTNIQCLPQTLEAKILFDADKLDGSGAIGLGRSFMFAGKHGARLHNDPNTNPLDFPAYGAEDTAWREYLIKLQYIQDTVYTSEAKRMAKHRHEFMVTYFEELQDEIEGRK